MTKPKKLTFADIKCITKPIPYGYFVAIFEAHFVVCWYGNAAGIGYIPHRPIKVFKTKSEALELLDFFNNNRHKFWNKPYEAEQYVLRQKHEAFLAKATEGWETIEI